MVGLFNLVSEAKMGSKGSVYVLHCWFQWESNSLGPSPCPQVFLIIPAWPNEYMARLRERLFKAIFFFVQVFCSFPVLSLSQGLILIPWCSQHGRLREFWECKLHLVSPCFVATCCKVLDLDVVRAESALLHTGFPQLIVPAEMALWISNLFYCKNYTCCNEILWRVSAGLGRISEARGASARHFTESITVVRYS